MREPKNEPRGGKSLEQSKYFSNAKNLPKDPNKLTALSNWAKAEGNFRAFIADNSITNVHDLSETLDEAGQQEYRRLEQVAEQTDVILKEAIPDVTIQDLSCGWIDPETKEVGSLTLRLY